MNGISPATGTAPNPLSAEDWFKGRTAARQGFLSRCGWADAALTPAGGDSAFRRYFRLRRGNDSAVLMESVPDGHAIATPGHSLKDFMRIDGWLRETELNAPAIFAADPAEGYLLLEDFGDVSFWEALRRGADPLEIYGAAVDILIHLRRADSTISLPDYYASHVHKGRRRVVDWYLPAVLKRRNADGLAESYLGVWDAIEKSLPPCPQGFLHIDYHVENLMWLLAARNGLQRCGILDFQGAMTGPLPYDLANLLEDARIDVDESVRRAMLDRYCAGMNAAERKTFESWYRVLATQFHCRVAGQFIRLAVRDCKTRYLDHLPRLCRYLATGLADPLLKPLKDWFAGQGVDFRQAPVINPSDVAGLIRPDAF